MFHAGVLAIIYITSLTRIYLLPHRRFSLGCSFSIELMASIFSWGWLEDFICLLIIWGEKVGLDLQCFAAYTELDTPGKTANLKNRTWNSLPLSFIWYRQNECCFSWVHLLSLWIPWRVFLGNASSPFRHKTRWFSQVCFLKK